MKCLIATFCSASLLLTAAAQANVLQPVAVSTNMGGGASINMVRDQTGLSTGYTSGVTDLNTYLALNPIHDGTTTSPPPIVIDLNHVWQSNVSLTTGNIDFDLGGAKTIDAFIYWGVGIDPHTLNPDPQNITAFTLLAADNPAFTNPITLGNFTPNLNSGVWSAVHEEVFTFGQTVDASYVRMEITGNNGDTHTGLGQVAFDGIVAVPEPATLTLLIAPAALLILRRRQPIRPIS